MTEQRPLGVTPDDLVNPTPDVVVADTGTADLPNEEVPSPEPEEAPATVADPVPAQMIDRHGHPGPGYAAEEAAYAEQTGAVFGFACGGCTYSNGHGSTQADVEALLIEHAECATATTRFKIQVPSAQSDRDAAEAWHKQVDHEGFRWAANPEVQPTSGRVKIVTGLVVPFEFRMWDNFDGEYRTPQRSAPAAPMPPGGEPA